MTISRISESDVFSVVSTESVSQLVDDVCAAALNVTTAVDNMATRWRDLPDVFAVDGADGAYEMFTGPALDASAFNTAVGTAAQRLSGPIGELQELEKRRRELIRRIGSHNSSTVGNAQQLASAIDNEGTSGWDRMMMQWALSDYERADDDLRADIAAFNSAVETTEADFARALDSVTGGDVVLGADSGNIGTSDEDWGEGGEVDALTNLADIFRRELSSSAVERITTLAQSTPGEIEQWLADHPQFMQSVPLIEAEMAKRLWEGLSSQSGPGTGILDAATGVPHTSAWGTGPLATLLLAAPGLVGNLNGIPAKEKDRFNRAYFAQISARGLIAADEEDKLRKALNDPSVSLLTMTIDTDGEARAAVAFGDIDTADLIVTVTHGINTDVSNIEPWMDTADQLKDRTEAQIENLAGSANVATVAYFAWDSGTTNTVMGLQRPASGAVALTAFLQGVQAQNPDAVRAGWFHSIGTTMGAESTRIDIDAYDGRWFAGSAGVSPGGADALSNAALDGNVTYATSAGGDWVMAGSGDWIAPMGRGQGGVGPIAVQITGPSQHWIDPRDVPGVTPFDSEAGEVDFGKGLIESGARTPKHDAHGYTSGASKLEHLWNEYPETEPTSDELRARMLSEAADNGEAGYFDPHSRTYLEGVRQLAELYQNKR